MNVITQKQNLRFNLRQQRRNYSYKEKANHKISTSLTIFLQSQCPLCKIVALYYPIGSEVSLLPFANKQQNNYRLALPKISSQKNMYFTPWKWGEKLDIDDLSIKVPKSKKALIPDVVCVPLLGFSPQKYRLGQGGGYYDKYIYTHKKKNILWVGVAFECQKLQDMPIEEHDQKLDYIITEKHIYE